MTRVFNDTVEVDLQIGGNPWFVIEAEVVNSRTDKPDYVDMRIVPDPNETAPPPEPIEDLVGEPFTLDVDNELISKRDTGASEVTRIFTGNLANISPTGENSYEAIAYTPAHQPFATSTEGSVMNQSIYIPMPSFGFDTEFFGAAPSGTGTQYQPRRNIKASDLVQRIIARIGISDYEVNLSFSGTSVSGPNGSYTAGYDTYLYFEDAFPKISYALNRAREETKSEWWFDREGKFHFGVPEPTAHKLQFITDADAGKTTPPYQSVRVIGSGAASQEGWARNSMNMEDPITIEARIDTLESKDESVANFGETREPIFTYRNAEISTQQQARNTAEKIINDLAEQQGDGKITVVGFPEVEPLDAVEMPPHGSVSTDLGGQPMGGARYGVYKVVHRLNNSDGFVTIIHCAGLTGVTRVPVSERQAETSYDIYQYAIASGGAGGPSIK